MVTITNFEKKEYTFKPGKEKEIIQNIENILGRVKGNVVLARHKGIDSENIDKPFNIIEAQITSEVVEEISREEPRFSVSEVIVLLDEVNTGKYKISVKGVITDE
ncbi:hypothetical protein [Fusobacterium ulcerans]|uniref:Uncharacterized protein n=1 Tax=Fusobacterium ulcerans 12-1B TaxID=457404 RepID=H1PWB8_9FUSO|nr:hypothetical protein [Fusobacterium ulcerans]EHO79449.1 hypothetical protein HMPREF0402_02711 [Fusobacterium ulcerans 12-1B]